MPAPVHEGQVLNCGTAAPLVQFENTVFAVALLAVNVKLGVVVAVVTVVENNPERLPAENDVTVPVPAVIVLQPNAVPVQVKAFVVPEHVLTKTLVGAAGLAVGLPSKLAALTLAILLNGICARFPNTPALL